MDRTGGDSRVDELASGSGRSAALRIEGLRKSFGAHEVLRGVDLAVAPHEVICLIGASGSGKSTLLRCVNLLERIDGGTIWLDGQPITRRGVDENLVRRHIGIVFQSFNLFPHMTVERNVTLAPMKVLGLSRAEAVAQATELLERFGLGEKRADYPDRLSGGQQQRVAIVRALAMRPRLMLLDEVTSALDPELVADVLDVIRELAEGGMTMLIATHEMGFARDIASRVCFLADGQIVEQAPPAAVVQPAVGRTHPALPPAHHRRRAPVRLAGETCVSESSSEAIEVTPEDLEAAKESAEASEASEDMGCGFWGFGEESGGPFSGKTAWARRMETPLRMFLRTETGSASVLAGATVLALIWANISVSSYDKFWATPLSVLVGRSGTTLTLREFVNSGLMAFFFLVVGLEARREFDVGELRIRSRLTLPLLVGLAGMVVPIVIYLLFNAGQPTEHGWGMAMSTDTAFALGALALVGRRLPDRVRIYLLTFSVVDDLAGLAVIAVAYSGNIEVVPLLVGLGLIGVVLILRARSYRNGPLYLLVGIACLGGVPQVGRGPDRGRPDLRAADLRVLGQPGVPGAGLRGVPDVPRAAHRRAGPVGAQRGAYRDLAERPAGPALPPVDQLRHRAAVRPGQRGDRAERRVPGQAPTPRRSRSASWSVTWWASRSARPGARGWSPSSATAGCGRPSAGARWSAPGRSPVSASPCPC